MRTPRSERDNLSSLVKDETGAIAIYVALMLPFLVGLSLLVVDGGRLFNLDTSLQNNVDALALAGAAELDRRTEAHRRACRAMQQVVSNKQLFVTGNATLDVTCDDNGNPASTSDVEWCWLRSLPPDGCKLDLAFESGHCRKLSSDCDYSLSTSPETSYYLWVKSRVEAADFTTLMPTAFIGADNAARVRRSAVAGMTRAACQPVPLMICNPWESEANTVAALRGKIGSMTTAREYGGGAAPIGPGQFGLLDPGEVYGSCPNTGGIVDTLTWQLAGAGQGSCKAQNGLCPKTGVVARLDNAVNTRFDIYKGMNSLLSQDAAAVVPAARTIWNDMDRSAEGCEATSQHELSEIADGVWYPREANWNRVTYFSQYSTSFPSLNSTTSLITLPNGQQKQLGTLTRYETYQWEAHQAAISTSATPPFTFTKPAARTCFAEKVANGATILNQLGLSGRLKRRDIYAAVANCLEIKAAIDAGADYSLNGSSTHLPLPSLAIAKFFITEPMNRTHEAKLTVRSSEGGPASWPEATCSAISSNRFWVDMAGQLVAGKTYYLKRPSGLFLDATLPDTGTPTIAALATAFNAAAADAGLAAVYKFCSKTTNEYLFISSTEATSASSLEFGLSVSDAAKRIFLELVDVYASDNGGDVTRDVVRLYR